MSKRRVRRRKAKLQLGKRNIVEHVVERLTERVMEALAAENAPDAAVTLTEYREQCARIAGALGRTRRERPRQLAGDAGELPSELAPLLSERLGDDTGVAHPAVVADDPHVGAALIGAAEPDS